MTTDTFLVAWKQQTKVGTSELIGPEFALPDPVELAQASRQRNNLPNHDEHHKQRISATALVMVMATSMMSCGAVPPVRNNVEFSAAVPG